jgi:hypothetical protein
MKDIGKRFICRVLGHSYNYLGFSKWYKYKCIRCNYVKYVLNI